MYNTKRPGMQIGQGYSFFDPECCMGDDNTAWEGKFAELVSWPMRAHGNAGMIW